MEQNTPKFRLRLNLFDGIVLVLALAVAALLAWRALKPAAVVQADPAAVSTVRYTIRFQGWAPGSETAIHAGDTIADNIKNYELGHVVSVQTAPALVQAADQESRRYVWAELEGFEDVLVTVESPCTVSDAAVTVGGGYEVRVGSIGYYRGEGYLGSGPVTAIEIKEAQG